MSLTKTIAPPVLALVAVLATYLLLRWAFAEVTSFRTALKKCVAELQVLVTDLENLTEKYAQTDKTVQHHDVVLQEMRLDAKDFVQRKELVDSLSRSGNSIFARINAIDGQLGLVTRDVAVLSERTSGARRKKT